VCVELPYRPLRPYSSGQRISLLSLGTAGRLVLLATLFGIFPALIRAQIQSPAPVSPQQPEPTVPGSVVGKLVDPSGTPVPGAHVKLTPHASPTSQESVSGEDGQYSFSNVPPGPFQLSITSEGFAAQQSSGTLHSAESLILPPLSMNLATNVTEVHVELSTVELAQEQMKDEEKQRVLGVIPNFYISYVPNAAPLNTKQKFNLAWKSTIDPVNFILTGAFAGVQQARNDFSGYGQGADGYAKRYAADYADGVIGTYIGSAILPSLLKQDPRYFYKGTGTIRERALYAIANAVIRKSDKGRWQPDYSGIGGDLIAGAISNLYYPASDRNGAGLTIENALLGLGATAATNLIQEFILKKFTTNVPQPPANSLSTP
jgi:Carboxypeptidase regulatory-like domain